MQLGQLFKKKSFVLSFEIFPPKNSQGDENLFASLQRLSKYRPDFVSCTYGAGGSTQERTLDWCSHIQKDFNLTATAHFTCVGSSKDELASWLDRAVERGIENIMALRGDAPKGQDQFRAVAGGFSYAHELVSFIRERHPQLGIGVAGYPEKHPEAPSAETDLSRLKAKVECGADAVYTQLFFENQSFLNFWEAYQKAGIKVPLVPGIMPITNFSRIKRITSMCGAYMPESLYNKLEAAQDDAEAQFEIGVEHAITQCQELLEKGVSGLHFYVLNQSSACERILHSLDFDPSQVQFG